MFRTTFVTGNVIIGTAVRLVTAHIDDAAKLVEYRTVTSMPIDITDRTIWKTLKSTRNALEARLHQDRRFSAAGPSMFAFDASKITARNGKIMGRTETTVKFIGHMLAVSGDETFRGQTRADREADAAILIAAIHVL